VVAPARFRTSDTTDFETDAAEAVWGRASWQIALLTFRRLRRMSESSVDLTALARRLADRRTGRTEANVQSDLHMLLTTAPLQLDDADLQEIILESPAGQRRRIDVEAGFAVFEVKRDLRVGNVRADAVTQLAGYVSSRHAQTGQRYVGVLTDGAEWHLHHLVDGALHPVSSLTVDPTRGRRSSGTDLVLWHWLPCATLELRRHSGWGREGGCEGDQLVGDRSGVGEHGEVMDCHTASGPPLALRVLSVRVVGLAQS